VVGIAGVAYIVVMTAWGYSSWTPVYVVVAVAALIMLIAWATRERDGGGAA
jgi:hypothetical protein